MLLGRGALSPNQHRILGAHRRAAARAKRLIADLLDFTLARVGSGLRVTRRALNLHGSLTDVVEELALSHSEHSLQHHREGEGECEADGDRLSQVIGNLVGNAAAYGDRARPITIYSKVDHTGFTIQVHNHGEPIAKQALERIFEPMQRGTKATSSGRSVGLGLYIVREIARAPAARR